MGYIIRAKHKYNSTVHEIRRGRFVKLGLGTYYHHPSAAQKAIESFKQWLGPEVSQLWELTTVPYSQILQEGGDQNAN